MRRIYSHQNMAMVQLAKNELENLGIASVIRGEHLTSVAGGGASLDAWVELWIVDDHRLQEAAKIIQDTTEQSDAKAAVLWMCPNCSENIEAQFSVCWNCGYEQS